ncbi:MAG TPA: phosphoglucosamine mutase [Bryobacteraceae bacterium]|nr:phosphoglucosamine mutase [Bryobacteraceae bacterium]
MGLGKQLFGTDGIRGVAGQRPLDPKTVYAFGVALAEDAARAKPSPEILIGSDTRESGQWIAEAAAGGMVRAGARVRFAGVVTTPGVAYLTRTGPFAAGLMISASHNPYLDNGLKVFAHDGFKLPDAEEAGIERRIFEIRESGGAPQPHSLAVDESLDGAYLEFLASTVSARFDGWKIALDCGNGSAYRLAPALFEQLGAETIAIGVSPDGRNINLGCGSLHVEKLSEAVLRHEADFGVAFDGDADRAIFVSRAGKTVNGDGVLLACARAMKTDGTLRGDTVVSTVMSNLGLEKALERAGIRMLRTPVGDKYVLEEMVRTGASLGGEQSGHIIFRDYATTGDGILTALRLFEISLRAGVGLDELTADLLVYPQRLVNVRVRERKDLAQAPTVAAEIRRAEDSLAGAGRVLVRYSGTEPLARVMVEAADADSVERFSASIAEAIRKELGE